MKRLPLIAALGVACSLIALPATGTTAAHAASTTTTYHGTAGSAKRLTQAATFTSLPKVASAFRNEGPRMFTPLRRDGGTTVGAASAASAAASTASGGVSRNGVSSAFNGLSDLDSDTLNGFPVTPPDQGLCVGNDGTLPGSPKAIFEAINLAERETSTNGTLLRPDINLATLFQDSFSEGDPRCIYDRQTQSFYFTEIGFPVATGPAADDNNTTADVLVVNAHGVAAYQFDTSLGGPSAGDCFGDQPKTGFDNNAVVISTDEYCGPTESNYEGAIAVVISKSQLVTEATTVNDSVIGPVSLAGDPVVGMDPAIGTGTGTAYFVNSVPFLANGNNNPVGNTLGLWTLTNSAAVTTGHGTVSLTSTVLPSEPYAFPVPATSTGDGSTTTVDGAVITSEAALNTDDSRLAEPVEVTHGFDGIQLWTALDAAVTPRGDGTVRDAAAWFKIDVGRQRVAQQGYVTAKKANLLYPAIGAQQFGSPKMVFTITSPTINPSAAYTTLGSGRITTVAAGAGAHLSFADAPPFNSARWGDYSFAQPDPDGSGVWMATEYIPPAASQDPLDNWGTYVFKVKG
jgi:hypothetical protein